MKLFVLKSVVCLLLLSAGSVTVGASAAEVQVRLTDGRALQGSLIENQTNVTQLTIEARTTGISIRRTLAWNKVESVKVLATREIREKYESVEAAHKDLKSNTGFQGRDELSDYQAGSTNEDLPLSELVVFAQPVSTFGKTDWDSLRLSLRGFDQLGVPVPLFGTLQVTLWGLREESGQPVRVNTPAGSIDVTSQRRLGLDQIHTWTRSLDSTVQRLPGIGVPTGGRAGNGGTVYEDVTTHPWNASGYGAQSAMGFSGRQDRGRPVYVRNPADVVQMLLSLPQPLPDSDATRWPLGEVTVELLMPGVGVFSASSPGVALVHQSPLRQELLNQSGSRFFPNEATTDGRAFWRDPGRPSQLRQITPPFPTPIVMPKHP